MSKHKKKRNQQSIKEAQKAQAAVGRESFVAKAAQQPTSVSKLSPKSYELPIKEIKVDLVKNLVFVAASVVFLIVLSVTKFGYAQLSSIFKI